MAKRVKREEVEPASLVAERKKEPEILVEATPVKPVRQGREYGGSSKGAKVLVQDTPVKREPGRRASTASGLQSQMLVDEDEGEFSDEEDD